MSKNEHECLFHIDLGFPEGQKLPTTKYFFSKYSQHALAASKTDRYGEINLPRPCIIDFGKVFIFEIGKKGPILIRIACRMPYNEFYDVSYVVSLTDNTVITVWLNDINDTHNTLDESRYCKPNCTK